MQFKRTFLKQHWQTAAFMLATFGAAVWIGTSYQIKTLNLNNKTGSSTIHSAQSHANKVPYEGQTLSGYYLASRFAQSQQDYGAASTMVAQALRHDQSSDTGLLINALRTLVATGHMDEAAEVAERLASLKSDDPLVTLTQMVAQVKAGNFEKAKQLLESASKSSMFALLRPVMDQWLALGENLKVTHPITLAPFDDSRAEFLKPFMHYQLGLMNDMAGYKDVALKEYLASVAKPDMMPYRLVQAVSNFYLRQGERDKAQAVFDRYIKANPTSELIPDALPGGDKNPVAVVPMVETPIDGMAEVFFTTASLLFGEQVNREAMMYLNFALYLRPNLPAAQLMLANLFEQVRDYDRAIEIYQSIDPETIFYRRAQMRIAVIYSAQEKPEQAMALLSKLANQSPRDAGIWMTLADVQRTQKKFGKAVLNYTKALELQQQAGKVEWALYYVRGICYERSKQWDKAQTDFEAALKIEPDQPDVLNYLGYSWLVMGKHHAKAMEFITKALDQRPADAHIIDSMAWAHYLSGEFDKALEYMEKAVEISPADPTINEHLGDVYWRLNRQDEARFQWQRAITFKPDNEKDIQLKIEKGMETFVPLATSQGDNKETDESVE